MATPTPLPSFDHLPRFYGYRDILDRFDGDTDAFVDAFCDGTMPLAVRTVVEDTLAPHTLHAWLLRRLVRQMGELLVESRKPVEFPAYTESRKGG